LSVFGYALLFEFGFRLFILLFPCLLLEPVILNNNKSPSAEGDLTILYPVAME